LAMADSKKCSTCHLVVPLTEFNRRAAAPDGLQARCRACSRQWYEDHRAAHIANVFRRNKAYRAELAMRILGYLAEHPCVDCGETDFRCLKFDHRDRKTKTAAIASLLRQSRAWGVLVAEIEKCDVRCANCHRRKTLAEDNSWRHRIYLDQQARLAREAEP
jgi:hypothetical protein